MRCQGGFLSVAKPKMLLMMLTTPKGNTSASLPNVTGTTFTKYFIYPGNVQTQRILHESQVPNLRQGA